MKLPKFGKSPSIFVSASTPSTSPSPRDYFNIEEEHIFRRVRSAVLLTPPFHQVLEDKPDLYGPFWIATTLIVVLIGSSSLMSFFNDPSVTYDFNQISVAASLVSHSSLRSTESRSGVLTSSP
jgi:hypothetical protein